MQKTYQWAGWEAHKLSTNPAIFDYKFMRMKN